MSVQLIRGEFRHILTHCRSDPERKLYNDVIFSVTGNDAEALKDVLEKGLKERGVEGRSTIKRVLNSLDFAPTTLRASQLRRPEDPIACDLAVSLPLNVSCLFGCDKCTALLLAHGADPNGVDEDGEFPLAMAFLGYKTGLTRSFRAPLDLLVKHGMTSVDMTTSWGRGETVLFSACEHGSRDAVESLLLCGADVNRKAADGRTALHIAVQYRHLDIVGVLVDGKADINAQEKDNGLTPLLFAVMENLPGFVSFLLQQGAAVDLPCTSLAGCPWGVGATSLFLAVKTNSIECVRALMDGGAHPLKPNKLGAFPLLVARCQGLKECTQMLEKGVDSCPPLEQLLLDHKDLDADGLGLETFHRSQLKELLLKVAYQPGLEGSKLTMSVVRHFEKNMIKVQTCPKASAPADATSRLGSSSAAAQPASSAASHPGPSTSSTSAKTANETSKTSSSSAAAQLGPSSAASNPAFQARSHSGPARGSKGRPDELQTPSGAAAQPPGPRPAVKACLWCGASGKRLKCCSGCGTVWLCGQDCQRQSWPGHRAVCKETQRKTRAEQRGESKQDS